MFRSLRSVVSLLVATMLLLAAAGLLGTLIPLRGMGAEFSNAVLGALTSAYYAGFLAGTFAMPPMVRRVGHIRAFAFCTACVACVVLLLAIWTGPIVWIVLRFVSGMLFVGLYAIIESWLNAQAPHGQRGSVFAAYMMVNYGGLALGQQMLRIEGQPYVLFTVVALLTCAASLPVVLTHQAQPAPQTTPRIRLRQLIKVSPTTAIGAICSGLAMGAFYGMAPVYARRVGFDTVGVSTYMTAGILGGAALQLPLGRWSDRSDRRLTLATVGIAAAVLAILIWIVGGQRIPATVLIFLYLGMAAVVYPIVVAHLVDYLAPEELLAASNGVLFLYGIGSALGPLITGFLMGYLGPAAIPIWFAATNIVLAAFAGYRYLAFRRRRVTDKNFRPMSHSAAAALKMMPEARPEAPTPTPAPAPRSGS